MSSRDKRGRFKKPDEQQKEANCQKGTLDHKNEPPNPPPPNTFVSEEDIKVTRLHNLNHINIASFDHPEKIMCFNLYWIAIISLICIPVFYKMRHGVYYVFNEYINVVDKINECKCLATEESTIYELIDYVKGESNQMTDDIKKILFNYETIFIPKKEDLVRQQSVLKKLEKERIDRVNTYNTSTPQKQRD